MAGGDDGYVIERSLRFNSGDTAYISRTCGNPTASGTWTLSCWVKRTKLGSDTTIFSARSGTHAIQIYFHGNDKLRFYDDGRDMYTDALFRDTSAWYHIVVTRTTTVNSIYVNGLLSKSTTYSSSSSSPANTNGASQAFGMLYFVGSGLGHYGDMYLADPHFIDGQVLAPTDFGETDDNGVWQPKEFAGTYGANGFHLDFKDNSSASALGNDAAGSNNWTVNNLTVNAVDYTSQAVLTGSLYSGAGGVDKIFDGTTASCGPSSGSYVTFTPSTPIPITSSFRIRANVSNASGDAVFAINGSNVSTVSTGFPASGGIVNAASTWTTITGYTQLTSLKFGWSGHWMSVSGIEIDGVVLISSPTSGIDSLVDTPTNGDTASDTGAGGEVVGNYATLNPLRSTLTLTNGNLDSAGTSGWTGAAGTIGMSSGKWYWEIDNIVSDEHVFGIIDHTQINVTWNTTYGYGAETGGKYRPGLYNQSYGSSYSTNDVIGIAFDADNGSLTFYKNGTSQGTAFTGLTDGPYFPSVVHNYSSRSSSINFGQRAFAYTAPSGYKALCTANLPEPTIADPSQYFDTKLWTGNGTNQNISTSFSPDWVWVKERGSTGWNTLYDTVRGVKKSLITNDTRAEQTLNDGVTAFSSNSFTVSHDGASTIHTNSNGDSYVGWTWDAGTSTVSNTDGSITSQVRAQPNAGFSIVSFVGNQTANSSVGHGLNAAPKFIITKNRDGAYSWRVFTTVIDGSNDRLFLNATNTKADQTDANVPTSSVFYLGANLDHNKNGDNMIAYCFTPIEGYSAMGSYVGNGSSNGPFVGLSFTPRWVMVKGTDITSHWRIWDSAREPNNPKINTLHPSDSQNETYYGADDIDFLSNGFRNRNTGSYQNSNGNTYIYIAFAEHPFKTARAR